MESYEDEAYDIMRSLDVDYVLVVFGGITGYSSDAINKFLWMVRIGGGVFPVIKEPDYLVNGEYRVDKGAAPKMLNSFISGRLTTKTTSPPGSNETTLLSRWCITTNGTGMTNMLVVTTTMRMLNWIHSHTTNLRPAVTLHPKLVKWLLGTSSTGNLTNHGTAPTWDNLLGPRWELDPVIQAQPVNLKKSPINCFTIELKIVADYDSVISRSPSKDTTVTNMMLDIANNSSFRDRSQRQDISDHKIRLLTTVDELSGVHSLGGDEELLLVLVAEGMTEGDAC
ncbi:hypothetical protein V2J09_001412 [Rumex salicifolius]